MPCCVIGAVTVIASITCRASDTYRGCVSEARKWKPTRSCPRRVPSLRGGGACGELEVRLQLEPRSLSRVPDKCSSRDSVASSVLMVTWRWASLCDTAVCTRDPSR